MGTILSFQELFSSFTFPAMCQTETISWFVDLIKKTRKFGGSELQVRKTRFKYEKTENIFIHVGASISRLFEGGELMDMKKRDNDGFLREFTVKNLDMFLNKDTNSENLLSVAEKQRVILHELENIRFKTKQKLIGYPEITLYPGQSLVQVLQNSNIISQMYPLHESEKLKSLGQKWYRTLIKNQPIDEIRNYFGEEIAMYFAFLGHYTLALVPPAIIGIIQLLTSVDTIHEYTFFAVFNLIWVTLFLERWKRNCSELAYNWGTIAADDTSVPEPRPNYYGDMAIDVVTGRHQCHYPAWKRLCKVYLVSVPTVMLSLIIAAFMMFASIFAENTAASRYKTESTYFNNVLVYLPSIIYAIMFEFVNNFLSMFYIAFYIQDMEMLRWQVAVMLIIQQMVNHFQEAVIPYCMRRYRCRARKQTVESVTPSPISPAKVDAKRDDCIDSSGTIFETLMESLGILKDERDIQDEYKHQAVQESHLDPYENTKFVPVGYDPLIKFAAIITQGTPGGMGLIDAVALGIHRLYKTAMNGGKKKTKPSKKTKPAESSSDEDYNIACFALSHILSEGPEKLRLNVLSVVDGRMGAFRSSVPMYTKSCVFFCLNSASDVDDDFIY
ncbi:Anoctamin-10 [Nymphon striatum]|nr:Anoctamin-10 [Nymphon striatum]